MLCEISALRTPSASVKRGSVSRFLFHVLVVPSFMGDVPFHPFLMNVARSGVSAPHSVPSEVLAKIPAPVGWHNLSLKEVSLAVSVVSCVLSANSPATEPPVTFPSTPLRTAGSTSYLHGSKWARPYAVKGES